MELFGVARLTSGRRYVEMSVPRVASAHVLSRTLADACPELVGKAILDDRSGLQSSYTLNLNGTSFLSHEPSELKQGDTLLLFSSQAGG